MHSILREDIRLVHRQTGFVTKGSPHETAVDSTGVSGGEACSQAFPPSASEAPQRQNSDYILHRRHCLHGAEVKAHKGAQYTGTRGRAPAVWRRESASKNRGLFVLAVEDCGCDRFSFQVHRLEKSIYEEPLPDPGRYLKPERLVPSNENFRSIASEVVEGKKGDLARARALYGHVIDEMRYMKHGIGWGKGDAVYACDVRTGNCTHFHSYFIALARSAGIPARLAIGAAIPSERNDGGIDGYHCWAEFYADGQWWPVDISEGGKHTSLSTYYFLLRPSPGQPH